MKITVAIMAHQKRTQQAELLFKQLSAYDFNSVSIVWDEINNEWHTGERALRYGVGKGEWHVVIQDDAILCTDFYDNLVAALGVVPLKSLISLYTGTVRPLRRRVSKAVEKVGTASWLRSNLLYWGVGIVIPTEHIEPVLEYIEDRDEPYDYRIGYAYQRNRLPVFYTNPSLVNHNDDLGSLIDNDYEKEPRVAHNFLSGPVQWNDRVLDI